MNLLELQAWGIYARRQQLREMQALATTFAGAIGMLLEDRKKKKGPNLNEIIERQLRALGREVGLEEQPGANLPDKQQLGQKMMREFGKFFGRAGTTGAPPAPSLADIGL